MQINSDLEQRLEDLTQQIEAQHLLHAGQGEQLEALHAQAATQQAEIAELRRRADSERVEAAQSLQHAEAQRFAQAQKEIAELRVALATRAEESARKLSEQAKQVASLQQRIDALQSSETQALALRKENTKLNTTLEAVISHRDAIVASAVQSDRVLNALTSELAAAKAQASSSGATDSAVAVVDDLVAVITPATSPDADREDRARKLVRRAAALDRTAVPALLSNLIAFTRTLQSTDIFTDVYAWFDRAMPQQRAALSELLTLVSELRALARVDVNFGAFKIAEKGIAIVLCNDGKPWVLNIGNPDEYVLLSEALFDQLRQVPFTVAFVRIESLVRGHPDQPCYAEKTQALNDEADRLIRNAVRVTGLEVVIGLTVCVLSGTVQRVLNMQHR